MKIKTITAQTPTEFDKAVNEALAEGYELKRRDVLPPCDNGLDAVYPRLYYAELELATEPEEEDEAEEAGHYGCWNCRHHPPSPTKKPCSFCVTAEPTPTEWEERECPDCGNCKHKEKSSQEEPCSLCEYEDDIPSKWEAVE